MLDQSDIVFGTATYEHTHLMFLVSYLVPSLSN